MTCLMPHPQAPKTEARLALCGPHRSAGKNEMMARGGDWPAMMGGHLSGASPPAGLHGETEPCLNRRQRKPIPAPRPIPETEARLGLYIQPRRGKARPKPLGSGALKFAPMEPCLRLGGLRAC